MGCSSNEAPPATAKTFPKNTPVPLNYDNVTALITDMDHFVAAVKALNDQTMKAIDAQYQEVQFETDQNPLLLNVYPDANGRIVFLVVPKDPKTGMSYLLTFDKNLPVVDSNVIEIQLRKDNPEAPITCQMQTPDSAAYMQERQSHAYQVHYVLTKRFFRSGTYDFDALRFLPYRTTGNAFIVFDPVKIELKDLTANLTAPCK